LQVAVLLYPGCIFFEIALATEILAQYFPVRYYTPDGQPHHASNGSTVASTGDLSALRSASNRAVLIPGGDPKALLLPRPVATAALQEQARLGVLIAGICAGNLVMASAGLMNGRRGTHNYTSEYASPEKVASTHHFWTGMNFVRANLVQDGNLITSQPWAYRQYAAAIGRVLGVLSEAEAVELESYIARRTYSDA
jgi:transcriptional regulator GlxA family with amidase domain